MLSNSILCRSFRYPLSPLASLHYSLCPSKSLHYSLCPSKSRFFHSSKPPTPEDQSSTLHQAKDTPPTHSSDHSSGHSPAKKGFHHVAWGYAVEFFHLCVDGSKKSYRDGKYAWTVRRSKTSDNFTLNEIRDLRRIGKDQIKLVPFSFFVIVPLAELLLPPYLLFFPNAIPKPFMPESVQSAERLRLRTNQLEAYKVLKAKLDVVLIELGYTSSNDFDSKKKFFIQNMEKISEKLELYTNLDSDTLNNVCDLIMMEHFDGTNIINQLYKHSVNFPRYLINVGAMIAQNPYRAVWAHPFFTHRFKFNFVPFENLKKLLLGAQLKRQLNSVKEQNLSIVKFGVDNIEESMLDDAARERGVWEKDAKKVKERLVETAKEMQEALGNNDTLLVWYAVLNLHKQPEGGVHEQAKVESSAGKKH